MNYDSYENHNYDNAYVPKFTKLDNKFRNIQYVCSIDKYLVTFGTEKHLLRTLEQAVLVRDNTEALIAMKKEQWKEKRQEQRQ